MQDLKQRTKPFAARVIRLVDAPPRKRSPEVIAGPVLRPSTSVGADSRAARRARSTAEFRAKPGIVEEEAEGAAYWPGMLIEVILMKHVLVASLLDEANRLAAIKVASPKTSRMKGAMN